MSTAKSGYIQRRIIKICEDIQIQYDGTVRDTTGKVVEFSYGNNGYDTLKTVKVDNKPTSCNILRKVNMLNMRKLNNDKSVKFVNPDTIDISVLKHPPMKSTIIKHMSEDEKLKALCKEKKNKIEIIKAIKKICPSSIIDENWTFEELSQRLEALKEDEKNAIDDAEEEDSEDDEEDSEDEEESEEESEEEEDLEDALNNLDCEIEDDDIADDYDEPSTDMFDGFGDF